MEVLFFADRTCREVETQAGDPREIRGSIERCVQQKEGRERCEAII
jgi:hypothetical protein